MGSKVAFWNNEDKLRANKLICIRSKHILEGCIDNLLCNSLAKNVYVGDNLLFYGKITSVTENLHSHPIPNSDVSEIYFEDKYFRTMFPSSVPKKSIVVKLVKQKKNNSYATTKTGFFLKKKSWQIILSTEEELCTWLMKTIILHYI